MRHEDFNSIELDEVLTKVLAFGHDRSKAQAVHWISAYGLARVREGTEENWQWAFTSADIIGHHLWSQPAVQLQSLYNLWIEVDKVLPQPWHARMTPQMLQNPSRFIYPVTWEGGLVGVLVFDRPRETNPVALMALLGEGLQMAGRYLRFAYQYLEARNMSYLDELTALYNQRYLPLALEHEIQRTKRDSGEFTLLFLDIDYFKLVNDGRGHWVGSRLLVELGKVLKGQVRGCDYCFRYGGDEFIVLLTGAGVESAKIVAERIRKAVESRSFRVEGHSLNLTVSIGLASYPTHAQTSVGLIQLADQAMYYGKRKSRNIVFVAS